MYNNLGSLVTINSWAIRSTSIGLNMTETLNWKFLIWRQCRVWNEHMCLRMLAVIKLRIRIFVSVFLQSDREKVQN